MSLSAATAAPSPITLAGKSYTASPVDLNGLGELEEHARSRLLTEADKLTARLPAKQREAWLDRALKLATAVTFDSEEFKKYLMTKTGMATLLSISLRSRHPEATPEVVDSLAQGQPLELVTAIDTVLRISGLSAKGEKDGQQSGEGDRGA